MKYQLESMERTTEPGKYIMKVKFVPGPIGRLFGAKERTEKYYGECTVWRHMPEMERVGHNLECVLADFWAKSKSQKR